MLLTISKWTLFLFGLFFICAGIIMLIKPKIARATVAKAGSTNFINYAELTIRMIPATAMILYADFSKCPEVFRLFGWFMLGTSIVLLFVSRNWHHQLSLKFAEKLKPLYFQIISPFSIVIGMVIIYCLN